MAAAVRQVTVHRGSVSSRVGLDGIDGDFVTESVVYSVQDQALNATRVMVDPTGGRMDEDRYTTHVRARGKAMFLQMPQWAPPGNKCWLDLSEVPGTMGMEVVADQTIPNPVAALLTARTEAKFVDGSGEVEVQIEGSVALAMLGVGARALFEPDLPSSASAPGVIGFDDDGRIQALRLDGSLVATRLDEFVDDEMGSFVTALTAESVFLPDDPSVTLEVPPAAEVMTDIETGCTASR